MDALKLWLEQHKLDSLYKPLRENDIDLDIIADITESDLTDIGISPARRERLLRAVGAVPTPAPTTRQQNRIIGRENELLQLQHAWRSTCRGTGCFVLIEGGPGVGKSRLLREMRDRLVPQAMQFTQWMCSPHTHSSDFAAVVRYVQQLGGIPPDHGAMRHELVQAPGRLLGIPEDRADRLLTLLGFKSPQSELTFDRPEKRQAMIIELLLEVIEAMVSDGPAVLVVEDTHAIDSSTLKLLNTLYLRITSLPLMVIVTCREKFDCSGFVSGRLYKISLGPLDEADSFRMITELDRLPDEIASEILRKADGIPMFVEEVTRMLFEVGIKQMNKAG